VPTESVPALSTLSNADARRTPQAWQPGAGPDVGELAISDPERNHWDAYSWFCYNVPGCYHKALRIRYEIGTGRRNRHADCGTHPAANWTASPRAQPPQSPPGARSPRTKPTSAISPTPNTSAPCGERIPVSERYEWSDAETPLRVAGPGTELGSDEVIPGHHALIIGNPWSSAYVIEASAPELQRLLRRAGELIREAEQSDCTLFHDVDTQQ